MSDPTTRYIARSIRDCREKLKMSQEDVAARLGMTRQNYGHIERGRNRIDMTFIYELCRVLKVTPNYLLAWEEGEDRDMYDLAAFYHGKPPEVQAKVKKVLKALVEDEPEAD